MFEDDNIFAFFQTKSGERGIFYFTHSGTILKFLAFLGLYRDKEALTSDNYDRLKDDRLWRTSQIDAFGSNVALVLKRCQSFDERGKSYFKCFAYLWERPIIVIEIFFYFCTIFCD